MKVGFRLGLALSTLSLSLFQLQVVGDPNSPQWSWPTVLDLWYCSAAWCCRLCLRPTVSALQCLLSVNLQVLDATCALTPETHSIYPPQRNRDSKTCGVWWSLASKAPKDGYNVLFKAGPGEGRKCSRGGLRDPSSQNPPPPPSPLLKFL